MANPSIPRDDVHRLAEACAEMGEDYRSTATRLLREQNRLTNFFKGNVASAEPAAGEVALYLYTVILRIFEQVGGRMKKANGAHIKAAEARINGAVESLLPFDEGFPERVRQQDWRAQPHVLDEALWALFERDEKEEGEVDLPPDQAGLVFLMLWAATEALEASWSAPKGYGD